jgi:hypothetical protein
MHGIVFTVTKKCPAYVLHACATTTNVNVYSTEHGAVLVEQVRSSLQTDKVTACPSAVAPPCFS